MECASGNVSPRGAAITALVLAFLTLPLGAVSFWPYAFRVDERGIWQRWYWRWDLWPWEAFAGGLIRHTSACYGWEYPDKPWYSRTMDFSILVDAERDWLMERVLEVWKPPPVELPYEIKLRLYGLPNRYLEISPRGIILSRVTGEQIRHYGWSDVVQMRVIRFAHWRQDFTRLELEFPAGEPELILGKGPGGKGCRYTGPDPEVVLAYLRRHVDADRVQFTASTGPPRTPDEAGRRRKELERTFRKERTEVRGMWVALVLLCLLFLFTGGDPRQWDGFKWIGLGLICGFLGLFGVFFWMASSESRRKYERGLAELTIPAAGPTAGASGRGG
jgi:hypothetical protein